MTDLPLRIYFRYNITTIIVIIQFMLLALPSDAVAQQYFVKSYGAESGLSSRIITDACQDREGYMWFSKYDGISKYDGFLFQNFDSVRQLKEQHYRKIRCDEKGIIWAVPYTNQEKIVFFKDNKWTIFELPVQKEIYSYITSFDVAYKNNDLILCIGTYAGIDYYQDKKWKHIDFSDDKSKNRVYAITKKESTFYLGTKIGLCVLNDGKPDWSLNAQINPGNESILAVSFEKPGLPWERLWILNSSSIKYLQNNKITQVAVKFLLEDIDIAHFPFIEIRKGGDVIFGNNFSKYLYNISENKIIPLKKKNGFNSNGASSLFIDREENIWFTDSRGINKLSNVSLVNYFETSGMPENEVTAIAETNDGRFILGHNNQLSILNNSNFKVIGFPDNQNSMTRVLDIQKDREGTIWFSANNFGIGRLLADDRIQWYPFGTDIKATSICQDNEGRIWIGTNYKLFYLKNNKVVEYEYNSQLQRGGRKIFPSDKGGIFISALTGLWHADKNGAKRIEVNAKNQDLNVFSYYRDKQGIEFVGTMNGLYYINKGMINPFPKNRLNIKNPVYFILQDRDSNYWFGTNNGVVKWDGKNDPVVFNTLNGLAGRETNRSAGLLDSQGRVWVGTDRGLTCFTPGERLVTPVPVVNLLYSETLQGEKHPLNEDCSISYTSNTVSFHFRGISFVNEELLSYKYKLVGYDKDWREASQVMLDKIKYVNLDPGKYKLCVMAKNNSGAWGKEVYSANIKIRGPFYFRWWFIISIILLTTGSLYVSYKIISQQLVNRTLSKEISERRLAEKYLQESEQRLSFVLEGSRQGTWDWDLTTNTVQRNQQWAEMLGYQIGEIDPTPENWLSMLHPDDKERAWSNLNDHLEGKSDIHEIEYRLRTKQNTYKWIYDRAMIVLRDSDGKPLRMSGTHTDIDERKQAAEELQKSEERLRLLLVSLPVAIYISPVSPDIDLSLITGNVKALTGFTEEDFMMSPDFWRSRIHPFDLRRVMNEFKKAPQQGGITVDYRWQLADGTYKWFHDQAILKNSGELQEYMGVFVDINDRKLAEQEIEHKNEQLSLINAEKDKLFSIISHDLRSPVNGFLGLTSLLTEELERLSTDQLREIASSLYHSASKVNDLLSDLLEWSRLQRGLTIFTPVTLKFSKVTDECIDMLGEQARVKSIEISTDIPAEMEIVADVHMLQLVLRNLLTNALKFTPKGGKITVSAITQKGKSTKISISDTGIGMSPELNLKLFKVNEKTSRKGTEGEPSSGLGLILCKEFVEKQNGKIWSESVEGSGSTFHFTIPLTT